VIVDIRPCHRRPAPIPDRPGRRGPPAVRRSHPRRIVVAHPGHRGRSIGASGTLGPLVPIYDSRAAGACGDRGCGAVADPHATFTCRHYRRRPPSPGPLSSTGLRLGGRLDRVADRAPPPRLGAGETTPSYMPAPSSMSTVITPRRPPASQVRDRSIHLPRSPGPDVVSPRAEHGRGLRLVDSLATSWGSSAGPDGKTVWGHHSRPSTRLAAPRRPRPEKAEYQAQSVSGSASPRVAGDTTGATIAAARSSAANTRLTSRVATAAGRHRGEVWSWVSSLGEDRAAACARSRGRQPCASMAHAGEHDGERAGNARHGQRRDAGGGGRGCEGGASPDSIRPIRAVEVTSMCRPGGATKCASGTHGDAVGRR